MAQMTPHVRGDRLFYQQDDHERVLTVETPAWFAWLATASTFAFSSDEGTFTARKERAGNQRGGWYWKAYRTQQGRISSAYLGKAETLTLERLNAAAQSLMRAPKSTPDSQADVVRASSPAATAKQRHSTGRQLDVQTSSKFRVPPPTSQMVPRPRLLERLQHGLKRPLTLIAAPAGFGKTTLVSTWLEHASLQAAWITLDPGDDDLVHFWTNVFSAVGHVYGGGTFARSLLHGSPLAPLPPIETILTVWIDELVSLPRTIVLVLDDFHLITAQLIHQAVTYLIEHLPSQLHVVIATRSDPLLPLARLRAHGHLNEIRAAHLRFTTDEAAAFLTHALETQLSADDIAALQERTEGWIAGLQLAALSMQGHADIHGFLEAFGGSHRYIIDYLVEEVLVKQPEPIQTFLLQTAILERLQAALCEAVLGARENSDGEARGQVMLEHLEQANLFLMPLDEERVWYRYHQLFAEALRHRLQLRQPDLVPELHRRASAWYEHHRYTHEAAHHALAAGDLERTTQLIERGANEMASRGEIATLRTWLEALPDGLLRVRPELRLWQGWLLTLNGQYEVAERLLQDLDSLLRSSATGSPQALTTGAVQPPGLDVSHQERVSYAGRLAAIRAFIAFRRGDDALTIALALQALEQLPVDHTFRGLVAWYLGIAYLQSGQVEAGVDSLTEASAVSHATGNTYAAVMAAFELARMRVRQGQLHRADESFRRALELGTESVGRPAATGPAQVGRGDLQREWNDLDGAAQSLQLGIVQCQQTGNTSILLAGQIALARVRLAQGNAPEADTLVQQIPQILRLSRLSPLNAAYGSAWYARFALARGDLATALRWANESKLHVDDVLTPPREIEYLTLARVLIAQQRANETRHMLGRLLHLAEQQGRMGDALAILILQALAAQASGNESEALTHLSRALSVAQQEGYIRMFVDEGRPMVALLRQAYARGIAPGYIATLLSAVGGSTPDSSSPARSLPEPLTEREVGVLRLLMAGLSNAAVARELVISVGTVKSHINHIYGKLGVQSRSQAIARVHTLHLF